MKVNMDKAINPQASSDVAAPEQKMNQEMISNSVAIPQNVTNTGSKQIAQQGLTVMSLQATVTRIDLQKQFEENTRVGNGRLDQAAADRFVQGNQFSNELTQKKPFDLVQNGTQKGNISVRPGFNQNEQLPGLDNHSKIDQNLKSIFQDAMSGKSPSQQAGSTLIDGAKTPNHNLGEGNLLNGTDTPGFKDPTDLSNFPNSKLGVSNDDAPIIVLSERDILVTKTGNKYEVGGLDRTPIPGRPNDGVEGVSVKDKDWKTVVFIIDKNDSQAVNVITAGKLTPEQILKNWEDIRRNLPGITNERIKEAVNALNREDEEEEIQDSLPSNDKKKRPADDATNERPQGPAPSTTPYNNLVDNEFTTFDSTGVDKYLRLAKGIQDTKINPGPEGSEGTQGGPAPNEPVPGSGVVDPPDRPVQPTKGPIPVTGPIRKTPGGIPR